MFSKVERLFKFGELEELFTLDPDPDDDQQPAQADALQDSNPDSKQVRAPSATLVSNEKLSLATSAQSGTAAFSIPRDRPPSDELLADLILDQKSARWIQRYMSLFFLRCFKTSSALFPPTNVVCLVTFS